MEKTDSLKRIEANRRNALRSTGPKTPEGKEVVRWNPLKHGLLSKEVVIQVGDGQENMSEFRILLAQLQRDLQPESILEEMLVEKIAICYWRLRRVLRCELGEIRKELDTAIWREFLKRADRVELEKASLPQVESRQNLKKTSLGLQYLIRVLEKVGEEVGELGHVSWDTQNQLMEHFGTDENGLAHWCYVFSQIAIEDPEKAKEDPEKATENPEHADDVPSPEECKAFILKTIDEEKAKLVGLREFIKGNERLEMQAKIASLALPSKEAVDKILRYETTIERQLYRAMNQLERLQRQRKGEAVPPPISVELSGEN